MMRRLARGAALATIATLSLAASAPAASWLDPGERTYVPVPDGKADHFAYEYDIEIAGKPVQTRMETWITNDRSRTVSTSGGTLLTEDLSAGSEWKVFYAETNEIKIRPQRAGRPMMQNLRTQAAILREQVEAGWLKVDGATQVGGRRALVLVDGPNEPVAEFHSERIVVDADSFVELEAERRSIGTRDGTGERVESVSRRRLVVNETVDLAAAEDDLRFGDHPGAKVIPIANESDELAAAASKRRCAAAKRARAGSKASRAKACAKAKRRPRRAAR